MSKTIFLFLLFLLAFYLLPGQNPFPEIGELYRDDIIPSIKITIDKDTLNKLFNDTDIKEDHEYPANFIFDNGHIKDTINNIGFRLRGNTSKASQKKSFKVSFNTFENGRKYFGVEKMNLNGEHNDPSVIRSKFCFDIARKLGIIASRANHVRLYINGKYYGLYISVEHVDENFIKSRYGNNNGNLYKCTWPSDLKYKGENPNLYKNENNGIRAYELKTNTDIDDYSDLALLIKTINSYSNDELRCKLAKIFDVDSYLKVIVFDILTGNWDNYAYNENNFYLYHNPATDKFEYILYDLDNTFGIDWYNIDWASRNIYFWSHSSQSRPLYEKILSIPEFKSRFTNLMKVALNSTYRIDTLQNYLYQKRELIKGAAATDYYRTLDYGFTYSDFLNSYDSKISGTHVKYGITEFIQKRIINSLNQLHSDYVIPSINDFNFKKFIDPNLFHFTAKVENASKAQSIKVYYRTDQEFNVLEIKDDGMNSDLLAQDDIFTSPLIDIYQLQDTLEYYFEITADDGQIYLYPSCFPQKYVVKPNGNSTLVINELMTSNTNTIADNYGEYDDWIELINISKDSLYLGDKYITDNPTNQKKWQLPNLWLKPFDFILLWADEDQEQGSYHTNFKLSSTGEYIGLYDEEGIKLDEIYFGLQQSDISFGRLPDGGENFDFLSPTPGYSNKPLLAHDLISKPDVVVYPIPASNKIFVESNRSEIQNSIKYIIISPDGKTQQSGYIKDLQNLQTIDLLNLKNGIYYLLLKNEDNISISRFIIAK